MNERQIACFLAVADEGNFSQAAQKLFITQPAVTHQIRMLEDELHVRLFERSTVSTALTEAGKAILQEARQLQHLCEAMRRRASTFSPKGRHLTLGIPDMMLEANRSALFQIVSVARSGASPLEVETVLLKAPPEHLNQLASGEVDLMLTDIDLPELSSDDWEKIFLFYSGVYVCLHRDHPLAKEGVISPAMLSGETLYGYSDGTAFLTTVRESLAGVPVDWVEKGSFPQAAAYLTPEGGVSFYTCHEPMGGPMVYVPYYLPNPIRIGLVYRKACHEETVEALAAQIAAMPRDVWRNR